MTMTQILECPAINQSPTSTPELLALKARQQVMWASGDFAVIGTTLQIVGESLCEAADLQSGSAVLDVACGNGNAALAAARRFCRVTGIDYVPALLARAAERAAAERLDITFAEADAEVLPFAGATFNYVLSTFGVMFAPDQIQTAKELVRVCRPGGKIAVSNWTPEGFLGDLLRTVGRYVPPPPGVSSPLRWGTTSGIAELFPRGVKLLQAERKYFTFRYESAAHFIDIFQRYYGPTHKAFAALDEAGKASLSKDIAQLIETYDRGTGGAIVVPGEYLEVVLERTAD
jgi:ubiquinone/menaquinone biosynthesis C-methylase UbiE